MPLWGNDKTALGQAFDGFAAVHGQSFKKLQTKYGYAIYRTDCSNHKVRIIMNGGGGYGPMWLGFAANKLADAIVEGEFNSAPNAYVLYEMAKKIDDGAGVLFLANNFMGDYLNNDLATELLEREGIAAKAIFISDDICSAPREKRIKRGGLHGIGQVCKAASYAASEGDDLQTVYIKTQEIANRVRTVSVQLRDQTAYFGCGFSGEPSVFDMKYENIQEVLQKACDMLIKEMDPWPDDNIYVSINTNRMVGYTEGCWLSGKLCNILTDYYGRTITACAFGTYFDVFSDEGFMICLLPVEREAKWITPVETNGFRV